LIPADVPEISHFDVQPLPEQPRLQCGFKLPGGFPAEPFIADVAGLQRQAIHIQLVGCIGGHIPVVTYLIVASDAVAGPELPEGKPWEVLSDERLFTEYPCRPYRAEIAIPAIDPKFGGTVPPEAQVKQVFPAAVQA